MTCTLRTLVCAVTILIAMHAQVNGEDQLDCLKNPDAIQCSDDYRNCAAPKWYRCSDGACIGEHLVCDGFNDCHDRADEMSCDHYTPHHETVNCTSTDFKCTNDQMCIPLEKVCDNINDCVDRSDEIEGCRVIEERCKGFLCKNKRCLTDLSWVCDGNNDCQDNSDEQDCTTDCTADTRKFKCESAKHCIPTKNVCDKKKDCADGSDEGGQCNSFANNTACATGSCPREAECFIWPTGPQCGCPSGFRYDSTSKTCEDINECERYGICSQGCENTKGSYRCTCATKFKLKNDGRSCNVYGSVEPLLLYAGNHSIYGMRITSNHHFVVHDQIQHVVGLSSDGHYVYWTDLYKDQEKIVRALEDGTKEETVVMAGIRSPEDIAVDWITLNVYFTDSSYDHIAVCTNEGHHCTTLIQAQVDQPRGIALLPQQGRMYWTDWGKRPMIAMANMDGSDWKELVTTDIHWPNGIALDWPNDRLYWVDAKLKRIESIDLQGGQRRLVLDKVLKHPYGITVFGSNIYWSDWNTKSIQMCDKFTGKQRTTLVSDRMIYGVHIYHPALYPTHGSPCEGNTCSHMCLLKSNSSFSCACPNDMFLNKDQRTCMAFFQKQSVIVAAGHVMLSYEHQTFGKHTFSEPKQLQFYVHKMVYNTLTGDVIMADNDRKVIYSMKMSNDKITVLAEQYIGNVTSLAFDFLGNNLYWTDSEHSTIEVLSLDTKYRATVQHFKGTEIPLALAVVPEQGFMLVALRSRYGHTHFDRIRMHGRGANNHIRTNGIGDGNINFYVNQRDEHIYWSDSAYDQISFTSYNCTENHIVKSNINGANSLAILDADIYWTSRNELWKIFFSPLNLPQFNKAILLDVDVQDEIVLVATTPTKVVDHPCQPPNGAKRPCSHVCVPMSSATFACLCPAGMVFEDSRNVSCMEAIDCFFKCKSGQCISKAQHCNGHKDCPDSSDEEFCEYHPKSLLCSSDQFRCVSGNKCIDKKLRCDKNIDCDDQSDEMDCAHYNTTIRCLKNQFECTDGMCIDASSRCDAMNDCEDGSDELRCDPRQCRYRDMFACASGQCLARSWECDGTKDCRDGSDELDCNEGKKCAPGFYRCPHGQCIDKQLVCNGLNDCGDNSDEFNCRNHTKMDDCDFRSAEPTKFQCISDTTMCLPISVKCNGSAECPRGEDEDGCSKCGIYRFECANSLCISLAFVCNKDNDCGDGSDELNCSSKSWKSGTHACHDHMFDCMDGQCVEMSQVCNGHKDCANGLDEGGQCEQNCADSECDHRCDRSPYGPSCSCRSGYTLAADKRACEDIDECETLNPCAQKCENTVGSYRCSCYTDFLLRGDKIKCKSALGGREHMLYSSFDAIYNASAKQLAEVWSVKSTRFTGLDMNIGLGLLYYTTEESQSLYEFNVSTKRIRYMNGVGTPTKLAVDWSTNNVYVVDRGVPASIKICHMAKKVCVRLLQFSYGDVIRTIRVDPLNNRLFYTVLHKWDYSNPISVVYSRLLDGTHSTVMVNRAIHVSDLAFDPNKRLLYFAEMDSHAIYSIQYDGKNQRKIIFEQPHIWKPHAIALFEDELTVFSMGSKKAVRCKTYDNFECFRPYELNAFNMENLLIVQETKQRSIVDKCLNNNCNMVCVPAERGPKCLCADGVHVDAGVPCHEVMTNEVVTLHGDETVQDSSSTMGIVVGVITGLLCVTVLGIAVFVAFKKKLIRRKFVARVHFQNPATQTLGSSSPKKMQAPVLSTGAMRNEIFLNDINSDDLSECASSTGAEEGYMYEGTSLKAKLIRTNSR